ncbi:MAG: 6-phosphofructokinase [Armatimonadetes bacterium]|nr:6-phosphofructokinase [Armatimonadota bacterium]
MSFTKKLGVLVGGGPAPGINGVIGAATIEAIQNGFEVIGIYDGFQHLMKGELSYVRKLSVEDVSRIHFQGGSILRTARDNPTKVDKKAGRNRIPEVLDSLEKLGITCLVTIGGDDTASSASAICEAAGGKILVAHVPKTIDNDLNLPDNMPTFGFTTARQVGSDLARNLLEDARTTGRWFICVAMGRKAGHLALGIGKAIGAHVTVVAEEWPEEMRRNKKVHFDDVIAIIKGAMIKRKAMGREDGLAVVAEGVGEIIDENELKTVLGAEAPLDEHGHIRLAEVPIGSVLRKGVQNRFAERGMKITMVDVTEGYEFRCSPPVAYDMVYTRDLGYNAIRFLVDEATNTPEGSGGLVCLKASGERHLIPFSQLLDEKGHAQVRLLDINSPAYASAYRYMIRLKEEDFANEEQLQKLAEADKLSPEEFKARFGNLLNPITGKKLCE